MTARQKSQSEPDLFSGVEAPLPPAAPVVISVPKHRLAEVAIPGPLRGSFTYIADKVWAKLIPGARVLVPFGNRTVAGFFLGTKDPAELAKDGVNPAKLKTILRVLDQVEEGADICSG